MGIIFEQEAVNGAIARINATKTNKEDVFAKCKNPVFLSVGLIKDHFIPFRKPTQYFRLSGNCNPDINDRQFAKA